MAKKKNAKEKRAERNEINQKRIQKIQDELLKKQQEEAERIKEEERLKEEQRQKEAEKREMEARKLMIESIENEDEKKKIIRKSKAKAAGLKSTFVLGEDKLLMTSFGKGNRALRDKYICGSEASDASAEAVLTVYPKEKAIAVSGRVIKDAYVDNPMSSAKEPGQDLIRCRRQLEKMYFGKEFEDNIHIQLIYNILDIEKILAVHVNNIVFSLDNLLRRKNEEHDDFIGYMYFRYTYEDFCLNGGKIYEQFKKLIRQKQMGYFGKTFVNTDKKGRTINTDDERWKAYEEKCYYLFTVIGNLRQATAHGNENTRASIYKMSELSSHEQKSGSCRTKACRELDKLYREKVHELNSDFLKMSGKDLSIFFQAYKAETPESQKYIIREYYKFVVLKTVKNMGFSIKRLRETMIASCAPHLADGKYDSVRKKLYRAVDFSMYLFYIQEENDKKANELVASLRASSKDSEKEYLYRKTAEYLWTQLKDVINKDILPRMDGNAIGKMKKEKPDYELPADVLVKEKADPFSEMIYLLTIFLDGKEINDLITQLINRFDNISSFLDVLNREGMHSDFNKNYRMFSRSKEISDELRVINSFARMSEPSPNAKKIMFIEAAQVLGYKDNDEELEQYIDIMLDTKKAVSGNNKNGFRNFIINNVIDSSRFKYLVRYGNPKKIRALAENETVVDFVLREIPDTQITAYHNSCFVGDKKEDFSEMRKDLSDMIKGLHFEDFENVYQDKTEDKELKDDKERKKNIIRLYLTVLYLLQKNLIYVNSRYFLAFHCAERDAIIYGGKKYSEDKLKDDRRIFAVDFVEELSREIEEELSNDPRKRKALRKKRVVSYLQQNFENSDKWSVRIFRNCTEHLNAIRNADKFIGDIEKFNSYFELYHYLVQRCIIDQYEYDSKHKDKNNPEEMIISREKAGGKLLNYMELVKVHKTYCKDFVKALNVPFAYNLPRYKNLSINELFDRHNYLPQKGRTAAMRADGEAVTREA